MQPDDYMSFLVRLWRDLPSDEQPGSWHGEIEQIQTGTRRQFCTPRELLTFLQQLTVAAQAAMEAPIDNNVT